MSEWATFEEDEHDAVSQDPVTSGKTYKWWTADQALEVKPVDRADDLMEGDLVFDNNYELNLLDDINKFSAVSSYISYYMKYGKQSDTSLNNGHFFVCRVVDDAIITLSHLAGKPVG